MKLQPHPFKITAQNVVIFHHLYIGVLLLGWTYPINIIGLLVIIDDIYEHTIDYSSPLRLVFDRYLVPLLFK